MKFNIFSYLIFFALFLITLSEEDLIDFQSEVNAVGRRKVTFQSLENKQSSYSLISEYIKHDLSQASDNSGRLFLRGVIYSGSKIR